nr:unnamed protein product [Spirometra erinaceieuropaei]
MLDIPYSDPQVNPQVVKKRRLSQSNITSSPTGPSVTDITMVADGERTSSPSHSVPPPRQDSTYQANTPNPYGPSPLLAPEMYETDQNIREWLRDLSILLLSVPPHEHTCYLLRFLSPPARRRAFDAGIKPTTDFERATEILVQLFDHPDAPGVANQRFATLRQHPTQSVDDFAGELMRLATIAYPNLPESDRDSLILHRFITGLHDHRATDILLLHPPNNLSSAIRQCRLYEIHHSGSKDTPFHYRQPPRPIPPPPSKPSTLPVRFPDFNPGCAYCTAFGPQAKRCGHNTPKIPGPSSPHGRDQGR